MKPKLNKDGIFIAPLLIGIFAVTVFMFIKFLILVQNAIPSVVQALTNR